MEAPFPVVAAVNGVAVGAGVGIALAADIVIAARSAAFVMSFAPKLGLVPDLGSSWMVPRLVGRARAMGMGLLGDKLSAEMAAQWGLIWACVDDAALLATARDTAQRLAAGPRHAAYELRRALMMAEGQDLAAQLEYEAGRQGELIARPEFQEGVAAFFARRAPQFP
jgi:2-(1,2-epoxy-1,2-dihydrophenyl)acetyl-CoA isomerase